MVVALIVFIIRGRWYVQPPKGGSALGRGLRIVFEAFKSKLRGEADCGADLRDRPKTARNADGGNAFNAADVENIKAVGRLTPVLLTFITFWSVISLESACASHSVCVG